MVPAAGLIFTRKRAGRFYSVLIMVLMAVVMLASLTACGLEGLENLNIDAEMRGVYTFAKPVDLLPYFQAQTGGQEIWDLGLGNGSLVLDIDVGGQYQGSVVPLRRVQRIGCSSSLAILTSWLSCSLARVSSGGRNRFFPSYSSFRFVYAFCWIGYHHH